MTRTGTWVVGGLVLSTLSGGALAWSGAFGACAPSRVRTPAMSVRAAAGSGGDAAGAHLSSRLPADAPVVSLFGVNEGLSVPAQLVRSRRLGIEAQRVELLDDARLLGELGARGVRANSHTYPFLNFHAYQRDPALALTYSDQYFETLGELAAVMVVGPWPGIQTANYTDRYLPDDLDAYAAFVRTVVERYDGDGIEDMPGLRRPVLAWEIDNEPDLHNTVPPRGAKAETPDPSTFETPAEYAEIVRVTAAAIRAADAGATILLGGMYNPRTESGRAYLEAVLASPGVMAAFDVLSLHCYRDEDSLTALDETIQVALAVAPDRPLWITETGVSSEGKSAVQTEAWQASMVVAYYGEALASGVERMFWHTLSDPPPRSEGQDLPFSHHSLYRTLAATWEPDPARIPKPSGAVYARLTAHLSGVSWGQVQRAADTPEGRLVWMGDPALASTAGLVYWGQVILPARPGGWQVEDLRSGRVTPAAGGASVLAPAWIHPRSEENGE